jgi:NAD(P)-dependent dehydrogenase (short-subunit alcohol dehydrogenase family)
MELWPKGDDSPGRWREVIEVNVLGPYVYTLAFEELLRRSPAGSIVYLGSVDGLRGNPHVPAYSASKGALVPLTHTMSQRLGSDGVRVNCVAAAGLLQTAIRNGPPRRDLGDPDLATRLTPLQRMPAAEEIASVVLFLASSDASYVSGAVVPVDGGRIAATPGTY